MRVADHTANRYGDFLIDSIDEFNEILDKVKETGFRDAALRFEISRVQYYCALLRTPIADACTELDTQISGLCAEVEEADAFRFPTEFEDLVSKAFNIVF